MQHEHGHSALGFRQTVMTLISCISAELISAYTVISLN